MVYTSNRDGGGSVPSGHLAHPPPEGRLRRTGIFNAVSFHCEKHQKGVFETHLTVTGKILTWVNDKLSGIFCNLIDDCQKS